MDRKRILLVAFLIVNLSSCQKLRDYLEPDTEVPDCRVVAITDNNIFPDETYNEHIHWVEYNDEGNPILVTEYKASYDGHMRYVDEQPHPHLYDDQNRLIQESSSGTSGRYLCRYVYEGDSPLPVRDTLYLRGAVYVEEFEYDVAGRMTRVLRRQIQKAEDGAPESDVDLRYYYDIRCNRQEHPNNPGYNGVIQYTDKPGLYSLHRVWQIRYRDFSRNATATVETFNEHGLPTKFADSSNTYFQPFLSAAPGATVQYECE